MAGHAIIAGLELWQATGDRKYADKAIELSKSITDSQQRSFLPGLTTPLTGFFYTAPDKTPHPALSAPQSRGSAHRSAGAFVRAVSRRPELDGRGTPP